MKMKDMQKLDNVRTENNRIYCGRCNHSITMLPSTEEKRCSWCGKPNRNTTIGHYRYKMYNLINQDREMKVVCL